MKKLSIKPSKDTIILIIVLIISFAFVLGMNNYIINSYSYFNKDSNAVTVRARVTELLDTYEEESFAGGTNYYTEFNAIITSGALEGYTVTATQTNDVFMAHEPIELRVGDNVLLFVSEVVDGQEVWLYGDIARIDGVIVLAIVFFILLILFGGGKGVRTIFSLVITCMAVFMVLIPVILAGMNIYLWSMIICAFIITMTIIVTNGISQKSIVSAIGCFSGAAVCAVLTYFMGIALRLTGAVDEESLFLIMLNPDNPIDLKAIIFAGILIGGVGAIMDVAISMSSSLYEVYSQNEDITSAQLMKSGITIGRDIIGTMANTLVLAYIGSSLSVVVLLTAYADSLHTILNREMIIVEMLQALAGSMGILLTIPLTAFVSGVFYTSKKNNKD